MVSEKRKTMNEGGNVKKRQAISFETKVAIIKKLDAGEKMVNVTRAYNMIRSTIGTIYKQKDCIMESPVVMQSTIISKKRGKLIKELEKTLMIRLENELQQQVPLSLVLIQEKAKSIFKTLQAKAGENAAEETFAASHDWFDRFKKRVNLYQVNVNGESASAKKAATEHSPKILKEIVEK